MMLIEYVAKGGVFIIPIAILFFLGLVLLCERLLFLYANASYVKADHNFFQALIHHGEAEVFHRCQQSETIIEKLYLLALQNPQLPSKRIEQKMETLLLRELPRYKRGINTISTIGNILPVLGLLGTVTGMIQLFAEIASAQSPGALSGGISVALITTQVALVLSIPLIIGGTFVSGMHFRIVKNIEAAAARLLEYIRERNAEGSL